MASPHEDLRKLLNYDEHDGAWRARVARLDGAELAFFHSVMTDPDEPFAQRKKAIEVVAHRKDHQSIPSLIQMMNDTDDMLRAKSAKALGNFDTPDPGALAGLIEGLKDPDYFVRECSARALCHLSPQSAGSHLEEMAVKDAHAYNRTVALKMLDDLNQISS